LGGETLSEQSFLAVEIGTSHLQLGFCRRFRRGRRIEISLLLGRIEPRQHITGINVGPDVHQPREHPATDSEREIGAGTSLDCTGQSDSSLPIALLHNLGAYKRCALDRTCRITPAGAQQRHQKRSRNRAIQPA
jgi:hypothetical protein